MISPRVAVISAADLDAVIDNRSLSEVLSERELLVHQSFPSSYRQSEWLLGRVTAKKLIAEYVRQFTSDPIPWSEFNIVNEASGRPVVVCHNQRIGHWIQSLDISISHTRGLAAAALTTVGRVGVDVEIVKEVREIHQRFYLSDIERDDISGEHSLHGAPVLYWTIKEAYLKALGTGLTVSPKSIRVSWQEENEGSRSMHISHDARRTKVTSVNYSLVNGHYVSVVGIDK